MIGGRDAKDRTLSALGPGLDRSAAPEVRHRVLALLAALPEGTSPTAESVLARLHWERPTRGPQQDREGDEDLRTRLARWTLAEAESLGVTGRGALSSQGRALLGAPAAPRKAAEPTGPGDKLPVHHHDHPHSHLHPHTLEPLSPSEQAVASATAARLLTPLLPEPLDHVLLQADLTAVAPGPLKRPLADMLGVLADVESKGGATVYRFTPGSVRRALDAGRAASDLHDFLTAHSRTPVPQPLAYLIDDVARRHGHLRIGAASAYVRCDDDAVLSEILADKRSANLRLRRLAPTVLAAQSDPGALLDGLRAMGFAPAAESAEGDVADHPRPRPPHPAPHGPGPGTGRPAGPRHHAALGGDPGDPGGRPGRDDPAQTDGDPGRERRTPAHQPRRDPGHHAGRRDDRRGGVDRLRQRRGRRQPARHRPDPRGGRLRDGVRPHGGRGTDVSAAPGHRGGGAGGGHGRLRMRDGRERRTTDGDGRLTATDC